MVTGTAPWLWMILTPTGRGRSVNLVPLRDLAEQLANDRVIEQFGGNLLVFAALGFLLPVRRPWFARSYRILLAGAAASSRWRLHSSPSLSAVTHPSTTCC
ncbi:VanZ family protein [Nocardia asiatica]|uniref:VanZ family protein n=1 Tax=Nocardia asiatica TaxID=209252 RepID=UPI003EDF1A99